MVSFWTAILVLSLFWHWYQNAYLVEVLAAEQARTIFQRDLRYRGWNADHGGVYVPVTDRTRPNPLLQVPDRDVTTTAGLELTLVNPAFMNRQVFAMEDPGDGILAHLTSLRPLRPENAPDAWETSALTRFEQGATEVLERSSIGGQPYQRLMRPFVTEARCLKCHARQGYRVGDIRGGLAIAIPLAPMQVIGATEDRSDGLVHLLVWLLGLMGLVGLHHRITVLDRRHRCAEQGRLDQLAFLQHILDTIPLPIYSKDVEGRFQHGNTAFLAFLGLPWDQVRGRTVHEVVPRDLADIHQARDVALLARGGMEVYQMEAQHPDGHRYPVEFTKAVFQRQGKVAGLVGLMTDLSGRVAAERDLRDSEARFRRFFDLNIAGVALHEIICDAAGRPIDYRFLDCNPAFERLTGLTRGNLIGRTVREVLPQTEVEWIDRYGRVALSGVPDRFESFTAALGRWFEVAAFQPVPGQFAVMCQDISARKGIEEALRRAHAETKDAMLTKSRFLSTMSHEIRTPLNGIIGLTSLLRRSPLAADQVELVDLVQMSGQHLLTLINDILDLAKMDAGRLELENAPIVLEQLIGDLHGTFDAALTAKSLAFRVEIDPALGGRIVGDPLRLRQVLANLMGNAIKFTEHGGVALTLRHGLDLQEHRGLVVEIRDTGIGIPAEYLPHLFEPFTQADLSSTRRFGGSGLGLTVVKRLLDLMGGSIAVDSTVTGTLVRLVIPQPSSSPGGGVLAGQEDPAEPVTAIHAGAPSRVLVVEDNPTNLTMTRLMLEEMGVRCHVAMDGDQALLEMVDQRFDAVLMDCRLPGRDGYATTREIRAREKERGGVDHLVIIAITGSIQSEDRQRCLEAGMDAVLAKPFTFEALRTCLAKWLGRDGTVPPRV